MRLHEFNCFFLLIFIKKENHFFLLILYSRWVINVKKLFFYCINTKNKKIKNHFFTRELNQISYVNINQEIILWINFVNSWRLRLDFGYITFFL